MTRGFDDDDAWWDEPGLVTGSLYDLGERPAPEPRLAGMRSVSAAAAKALAKPTPGPLRRPVGFVTRRRG